FTETANAFRAALETTMIRISTIDDSGLRRQSLDRTRDVRLVNAELDLGIERHACFGHVIETVITDLGVTVGDLRQDTEEDI
ncbi:MAG: hypothetical protein AAFY44_07885, partial [Pseudomonadota bacterium]